MSRERSIRRVAGILLLVAVAGLCLAACADTTPGKYRLNPGPDQRQELQSYRVWLGLVFAVQYALMLWGSKKLGQEKRFMGLMGLLMTLPLLWSKFGEWGYRLAAWILSWGAIGKTLIVLGSLLAGLNGVGNLTLYILSAFLFDNADLIRWGVLPSIVVSVIVNFVVFSQASNR